MNAHSPRQHRPAVNGKSPRTHLTGVLTTLGLALLVGSATATFAQTVDQRQPSLRERLVAGLRVRRPSEFKYIEAVVDTVNRGDLPEKVVNRMFFWSRSRTPKDDEGRRPIIYFQPGLNRVAAKMKVSIRANETAGTTSGR